MSPNLGISLARGGPWQKCHFLKLYSYFMNESNISPQRFIVVLL